jgi:tellurite resistance protein TerC
VSFPIWAWSTFTVFVLAMLALDLLVLHRDARVVSMRQAAAWSAVWVLLALGFGAVLLAWRGGATAQAFLTGYLIEKSLSVDNVFVYSVIFSMLAIPARYQHRVLMYGVVGALIMRGAFIAGGAALLDAFHATVYLFGALLIYAAVRVFCQTGPPIGPSRCCCGSSAASFPSGSPAALPAGGTWRDTGRGRNQDAAQRRIRHSDLGGPEFHCPSF